MITPILSDSSDFYIGNNLIYTSGKQCQYKLATLMDVMNFGEGFLTKEVLDQLVSPNVSNMGLFSPQLIPTIIWDGDTPYCFSLYQNGQTYGIQLTNLGNPKKVTEYPSSDQPPKLENLTRIESTLDSYEVTILADKFSAPCSSG